MTSKGSLARRYAQSLISLAKDENVLEIFYQDFLKLLAIISKSPELIAALSNDFLDYNGRLNAGAEIADTMGLNALTKNFLLLLIKKNRVEFLPHIIQEFENYRDQLLGIVRLEVNQPTLPEDSFLRSVEEVVGKKLGKKVISHGVAKPEMIGGLTIKVGNTTYDGSIKRELQLIKEKMLQSEV